MTSSIFQVLATATAALLMVGSPANAIQVTGATGGINATTGARPFRYDIDDLSKSGAAWDLFVLSLDHIQQLNQSDPLSYFQIAGKLFTAFLVAY